MAVNTGLMPIIADEVSVRLGDTQALDTVSFESRSRRDCRHHRPERCWQKHFVARARGPDTPRRRLSQIGRNAAAKNERRRTRPPYRLHATA